MSNDNGELEPTNQPSEEDVKTEDVEVESLEEDAEDASTLEEKNKRLYERAKKAEAEVKAFKAKLKEPPPKQPESTPSETGSLSTKDLYALMEAKVPQDDIDEVVEYAKLKNIPVAKALKTNVVKAILSEKAEERKTAEATSIGTTRRGAPQKQSPETLLKQAQEGKLPDDVESLVEARFATKKNS